MAVLAQLAQGGRRYQDLDDALGGVSHKVLTDTLRRAERDGLVVRHLDPDRVETPGGWSRPVVPRVARRDDRYMALSNDMPATQLHAGDRVLVEDGDVDYEVAGVEALQGRIQVVDTSGGTHSYHEADTVTVARPD